tara:strand:- start:151 stop:618 length:468 start_codon:yes stop_codon:yes gene_type:complete
MNIKPLLILSVLFVGGCSNPNTTEQVSVSIPEPESWAFPGIIESARKIAPKNIEGRAFDRFGLAYPLAEYKSLDLASLSVDELQKYADVVAYAYPDAVSMRSPEECSGIPLNKVNAASVGAMAYISNHAIRKSSRDKSLKCLLVIQKRLSEVSLK